MRNTFQIGFIIAAGFSLAISCYGNNIPVVTQAPPQDLCPSPQQLVKTDLLWSAPNGWVSYSESFEQRITQFIRAEWRGINVGKIICLYAGDKKYAFPIALEQKHNKLTPSPSGHGWGRDLGGYKECLANNVKDCPFLFEKPAKTGDVYQGLDFYKGKTDPE